MKMKNATVYANMIAIAALVILGVLFALPLFPLLVIAGLIWMVTK